MKISVIIPVVNEAHQLPGALEHAWQCGADEVIVVDGGSTDQTRQIALASDCLLATSPPGRAIQMNRGAELASGDVLVFIHADNWLAPQGGDQMRQALARNGAVPFGAFEQRIENDRRIYRWIETGNRLRVKWQGLIYGDQAFFIRRETFYELGGFPSIQLMEDFELSRRLKSLGPPLLLRGPTYVNARRWEKMGPVRQTVRNWMVAAAYRLGVSASWLAKRYRRHDK